MNKITKTPRFKIDKTKKFFIGKDYVSDGHWLVFRKALSHPKLPKVIAKLFTLEIGIYADGVKLRNVLESERTADASSLPMIERVLPRKEYIRKLEFKNILFEYDFDKKVKAFILNNDLGPELKQLEMFLGVESRIKTLAINPDYSRLLMLGDAYAEIRKEAYDERGGVVIKNSCNEVLAVVMPLDLGPS